MHAVVIRKQQELFAVALINAQEAHRSGHKLAQVLGAAPRPVRDVQGILICLLGLAQDEEEDASHTCGGHRAAAGPGAGTGQFLDEADLGGGRRLGKEVDPLRIEAPVAGDLRGTSVLVGTAFAAVVGARALVADDALQSESQDESQALSQSCTHACRKRRFDGGARGL